MDINLLKNLILSIILIITIITFILLLFRLKNEKFKGKSFLQGSIICFITDFFDNIGIGSFAPQTFLLKLFNITKVNIIPGTLNVAYIGAAAAESFLSLKIIRVDFITFILNVIFASCGSFLGARIVHLLDENKIKNIIGIGLIIAAITIALKLFNILPDRGDLQSLRGVWLVISILASFLIGIGISFGIGNFAPTLAVFMFLGFSAKAVFPIMMVSAFTTSFAGSITFIKNKDFDYWYSLGGFIFGIIGVFLSAILIFNLPEQTFKWITLGVVLLTSLTMFFSNNTKK